MNFNNFLVSGIICLVVGLIFFVYYKVIAGGVIKLNFKFPNWPLYREWVKYLPYLVKYLGLAFIIVGIVYAIRYFV